MTAATGLLLVLLTLVRRVAYSLMPRGMSSVQSS
uniref:Uncharacterized protein n=1 Tax=Setaria viridis TaxID=4556 RepID=A0A4U6SWU0_SETVI|nr:hypothetical protein SEVIR_9G170850v2 [Setaria viridis]